MKNYISLSLSILILLLSLGCGGSGFPGTSSGGGSPSGVEGQFVNSDGTKNPLANAEITLFNNSDKRIGGPVLSNNEGYFKVTDETDVPLGSRKDVYVIIVMPNGGRINIKAWYLLGYFAHLTITVY